MPFTPHGTVRPLLPWKTGLRITGGFAAVTLLLGLASDLRAATLYVAPGGQHIPPFTSWTGAATNLANAVTLAEPGDTVLVSNGVYHVRSLIYVGKGLQISSVAGAAHTVVHGSYTSACFQIMHPQAVVEGFTLTGGRGVMGGAVFMSEGATLRDCVVTGNVSSLMGGGGIYLNIGGTVSNCLIADNVAAQDGDGGGIYLHRDGVLANCTLRGNQARVGGGAVAFYFNRLENCVIQNNQAQQGGGLFLSHQSRLTQSTVQSNAAVSGGGVCGFLGGALTDCTVTQNTAALEADLMVIASDANRTCVDAACPEVSALVPTNGSFAYFVDPSGADTNSGLSVTQAFRTITRGASVLAPGNTLNLAPGIYREYVVLRWGGTETQPVVVRGAGTQATILRASDAVTNWLHHQDAVWKKTDWPVSPQQVFEDGQSLSRLGWPNAYLEKLPFTAYTPYGHGVSNLIPGSFFYDTTGRVLYVRLRADTDPAAHQMEVSVRVQALDALAAPWTHFENLAVEHANTFTHSPGGWSMFRLPPFGVLRDCRVSWGDGEGVSMNHNCLVERTEISHQGMSGINMGTNAVLRDCRIVHNTYRPFNTDWNSGGVRVIPAFCTSGSGAAGGLVERCEVAWNQGYGIWFDQCTGNVPRIVRNNFVHHNLRAGIMFEISRGGDIYNNLCVSNFGGGLRLSGSDEIRVWNNTLAYNRGPVDLYIYGIPRTLCDLGTTTNWASVVSNQVVNNVIYHSECDFDLGMLPASNTTIQRVVGNVLDHNLFFARTGRTLRLSLSGITWYNSVSNWHAATGWEAHSVEADPLLDADLRPAPGSPLLDAGQAGLFAATDRDGTPRPLDGDQDGTARADIGAFEFAHPQVDEDADGMSDADEVRAGTHPLDAGSVLHVSLPSPESGPPAHLLWPGAPDRRYRVARTTNLFEPFVPWETNIAAGLPQTSLPLNTNPQGTEFFRVEVE